MKPKSNRNSLLESWMGKGSRLKKWAHFYSNQNAMGYSGSRLHIVYSFCCSIRLRYWSIVELCGKSTTCFHLDHFCVYVLRQRALNWFDKKKKEKKNEQIKLVRNMSVSIQQTRNHPMRKNSCSCFFFIE